MCSGEDQFLEEGRTIPNCIMCANSWQAIVCRSGANRRVHVVVEWAHVAARLCNCMELRQNGVKLILGAPRNAG